MSGLFRSSFMRKRILITGSNGNLGSKLARHLISTKQFDLFLVDVQPESVVKFDSALPNVEYVQADLRSQQTSWTRRLRRTDVVVHFAAANAQPDASWTDASASMDITFNILVQACKARVGRIILASSCHVAGGYKEVGGVKLAKDGSNLLAGTAEPLVGMQYVAGDRFVDSTAYASAHFAGERLASALAASHPDTFFVAVRIGCCQPGSNSPKTITSQHLSPGSAIGEPTLSAPGSGSPLDDPGVIDEWLKSMWLSNEDFLGLFRKLVECNMEESKGTCLILNGVSANRGSRWATDASKSPIRYRASSDSKVNS